MPTFSVTQCLPTTAAHLFAYLSDPRNMPQWNSGVADVDDREPAEPGEGATYRYRFPGRRRFHRLVCSAYRAPSLLGFRGQRMWTPLGTQSVAYTFRLHTADSGCTLRVTVDVRLGGGMLLLFPVVALGWRRDLPEDMARLRESLADGPRPAGRSSEPAAARPYGPSAEAAEPAVPAAEPAAPAGAPAVPARAWQAGERGDRSNDLLTG